MKQTIEKLLSDFSETLTLNSIRNNKKSIYENIVVRKGERKILDTQERLEYSTNCTVSSYEEIMSSDIKCYVDKFSICRILTSFLESKINFKFYVSHVKNSTFEISVKEAKGLELGYPSSEFDTHFIHITEFKVKQSNSNFGEVSSYFHSRGKSHPVKMITSIVKVDEENYVKEIVNDYYKNSFKIKDKKIYEAENTKNLYLNKLRELNLTEEDFLELNSFYVSSVGAKRRLQ